MLTRIQRTSPPSLLSGQRVKSLGNSDDIADQITGQKDDDDYSLSNVVVRYFNWVQ